MIKKLAWLIGLVFLTSCGGGADVASNGVGSGGTGSYSSGPVSGLGSIIVNGVRYDVTSAQVQDDEDGNVDESSLQLGMLVEVKGSSITAGAAGESDTASATTVRVGSDFIGPVDSVTASTITVFGRTINIDSKTVYTSPINANDYVVVYGLVSPSGYTATRIETLSSAPSRYKVAGIVSGLQPLLHRFALGAITIDYGAANNVPANLRNGSLIRAWLHTAQVSGAWPATKLRAASALVSESTAARMSGLISDLTDQQHFEVNGVSVNASFLSVSGLSVGTRIAVEGKMVAGTLVASKITIKSQPEIDDVDVELHGRMTFVQIGVIDVRTVKVAYSPSVVVNGPLSPLACVEVRGKSYNSLNQLVATKVELKSTSDCR